MASLAKILGSKLLGKSGEVDTAAALSGKKAIGLYFSAHWCPPCRSFTPQLSSWYTSNLKERGLEIVFVSGDKNGAACAEYFAQMPWLCLPFADRAREDLLSRTYGVSGIPSLVLLGPDGELISKDGRKLVSGDPAGKNFPWKPKTAEDLLKEPLTVWVANSSDEASDDSFIAVPIPPRPELKDKSLAEQYAWFKITVERTTGWKAISDIYVNGEVFDENHRTNAGFKYLCLDDDTNFIAVCGGDEFDDEKWADYIDKGSCSGCTIA